MNARYANAFVQSDAISQDEISQIGVLLSEYEVTQYWDLRTASSTPDGSFITAYIVNLRQRLTISNGTTVTFGAPITAYTSYPILAQQSVTPTWNADAALVCYVEDYSPKTLNAAVSTSSNQGTNSSVASSTQHSSGSSTAVTNSYEVSATAGFFGVDPTGSVTAGFSSSTTQSQESSDSRGSTHELGAVSGNASAMSVKDWCSYAVLDPTKQNLSWIWGQEYPWNVIDFNSVSGDTQQVDLPIFVQERLLDAGQAPADNPFLYPPSQISQFGMNFVAHGRWVFLVPTPGPADEEVTFNHVVNYWEGSHSVAGTALKAQFAQVGPAAGFQLPAVVLNLPLLSLKPISALGSGNGAVVGFVASEFIAPPGPDPFRIKSSANNLYVTKGTNFAASSGDDSVLSATVTTAAPAGFTIQFKIDDPEIELALHLKHWKTDDGDCKVTFTLNGASEVVRYVDALKAGSGADNLTTVILRLRDYTSQDFYDYLRMGLNQIDVAISPAEGSASCGYAIRALAIQ
jgi:hypothetical protein